MTRIQPECFIEVWKTQVSLYQDKISTIENLENKLWCTKKLNGVTFALFLIKPTDIPLAERLEARKVNNN